MKSMETTEPTWAWKPGDHVRVCESFLAFHSYHHLEHSPPLLGAFAEPLIGDEIYEVVEVREATRRGASVQAVALRTVREIPFDSEEVTIKSGPFKGAAGTTGRLISPAWALKTDLDEHGCKVEPFKVVEGGFDEILAHMRDQKQRADARIEPWQRLLKPGDHFLTYRGGAGIVTWGEILDPFDGAQEDEIADLTRRYGRTSSYRAAFCSCSEWPEGEESEIHLSSVWRRITPAQFVAARAAGFPNVASEIAAIVQVREDRAEVEG